MKNKIFVILFVCVITFIKTTNAIAVVADTYKEGIYDISQPQSFNTNAKLVSKNPVTLIIVNSNGNQKFYKRFTIPNEATILDIIESGDRLIIIGTGEIAVSPISK